MSHWDSQDLCNSCFDNVVNIASPRCKSCFNVLCEDCSKSILQSEQCNDCPACEEVLEIKFVESYECEYGSDNFYFLKKDEVYEYRLSKYLEEKEDCDVTCLCTNASKTFIQSLSVRRIIKYKKLQEMKENPGKSYPNELKKVTNGSTYEGSLRLNVLDSLVLRRTMQGAAALENDGDGDITMAATETTTMGELKSDDIERTPWQEKVRENNTPFVDPSCQACKDARRPSIHDPVSTKFVAKKFPIFCSARYCGYRETTKEERDVYSTTTDRHRRPHSSDRATQNSSADPTTRQREDHRQKGFGDGEDTCALRNTGYKIYPLLVADGHPPCTRTEQYLLCDICRRRWEVNKVKPISNERGTESQKILQCGNYPAYHDCKSTKENVDAHGVLHKPVSNRRPSPLRVYLPCKKDETTNQQLCQGCYNETGNQGLYKTRDIVWLCFTCIKSLDLVSYNDQLGCKNPGCKSRRRKDRYSTPSSGSNGMFCSMCISMSSSLLAELNFFIHELERLVDNVEYPHRQELKDALQTYSDRMGFYYSRPHHPGFFDGTFMNSSTASFQLFIGVQYLKKHCLTDSQLKYIKTISHPHRLYGFLSQNPSKLHNCK